MATASLLADRLPPVAVEFDLAERLGMTVAELRGKLSVREFVWWAVKAAGEA